MSWYDPDDYAQEYALALLEGLNDEAAAKRAKTRSRTDEYVGSFKVYSHAAITTYGTEHLELLERSLGSFTMDDRPLDEIEGRFDKWDRDRSEVGRLLGHCTAAQRRCLTVRYGLDTGEHLTQREAAKVLGLRNHSGVQEFERYAFRKIRKREAEDPKLARRREKARKARARQRAAQRKEAA